MLVINKNADLTFAAIIKIAKIVWPMTYGAILGKEQFDYMMEMMYSVSSLQQQVNEKHHHFVIALNDGLSVGFASYEFNHEETSKVKIHKLYVLPNEQGKGVGVSLVNYIEKEAISQGQKGLILNVNRYNSAQHFYKKIGFSISSEEDIAIGNGYLMEDYVMEKRI